MNHLTAGARPRTIVPALVAAALAVLAGCEGGGGKVTLRFGSWNFGSCETFTAELDLAGGKSTIARLADGKLDCALGPLLATDGCRATYEQLPDGHTVRVRIRDCEIPAMVSDLFECGFTTADAVALRAATVGYCDCFERARCDNYNPPLCDEDPPVCVAGENGSPACEICNNELDDDDDGHADCNDPDCVKTDDCGWMESSTTVTCTTMTTQSTMPLAGEVDDANAIAVAPENAQEPVAPSSR